MTNNSTTNYIFKASASKQQPPHKKVNFGGRKFRRNSAILSESWRLTSMEEIRKAKEQVMKLKRAAPTAAERSQRCHDIVNQALTVLVKGDERFNATIFTNQSPPTAHSQPASISIPDVPSYDSLYGDEEDRLPTSKPLKLRNHRRYQRRCSVTEFSLKAAVLAKVQLEREQSGSL